MRIWDLATAAQMKQLTGHEGAVYYSIAFSPDGKQLVSGGIGLIPFPASCVPWYVPKANELV